MVGAADLHLGLAASDHDAQIRRYTPRYDEMIDTVVAIIAGLKAPYVIDLGAGTGTFAAVTRGSRHVRAVMV